MNEDWRSYVETSTTTIVAIPLVALATTSDRINRHMEAMMRHYYRVVVKAISLERKASRHAAAYDRTVLAESRSSALAKCQDEILALKCNDPTIKRISVFVGSNSKTRANMLGHWWRLNPISIPRGE